MDGFNPGDAISLIIVFALYLITSSGRTKKGRKGIRSHERCSPMRTRAQGEQLDKRAAESDKQTQAGFDHAFADTREHDVQDSCESKRIHLHEIPQQHFLQTAEGEDPCHSGGTDVRKNMSFELQNDVDQGAFAQDVLRGVIMSEILTRPQDRAAQRRGGR